MSPILNQVWDEVTSAWRYRWLALALAVLIALLGWLAIFSLPDRYEAMASVFVDTRTSLKPVLQGLTMEQDVDAQLNFVRQSLLAGPALLRIARDGGVLQRVGHTETAIDLAPELASDEQPAQDEEQVHAVMPMAGEDMRVRAGVMPDLGQDAQGDFGGGGGLVAAPEAALSTWPA